MPPSASLTGRPRQSPKHVLESTGRVQANDILRSLECGEETDEHNSAALVLRHGYVMFADRISQRPETTVIPNETEDSPVTG
jgi:hypothetical protein